MYKFEINSNTFYRQCDPFCIGEKGCNIFYFTKPVPKKLIIQNFTKKLTIINNYVKKNKIFGILKNKP